jgi:hypothetical protein
VCCILAYTVGAAGIQFVARSTLTAERAVRVDTETILADARIHQALVHICKMQWKIIITATTMQRVPREQILSN